jgi:hypothetical protein
MDAWLVGCLHNDLRSEPTNLAQTIKISNIRSKNYFLVSYHIQFFSRYNIYLNSGKS